MVVIGAVAIAEGFRHTVGTLTQMGSGYFPIALGVLLALLGVVIAAGAFLSGPPADDVLATHLPPPDLRGGAAIIGGVLAFLVLGEYAGLAPATFVSVFIAAMGDRSSTLRGAAILALSLTIVAAVLFVYELQVQFPLLRW
jgi:hypothetical protein